MNLPDIFPFLPPQSEKVQFNPVLLIFPICIQIITLAILPSLQIRLQTSSSSSSSSSPSKTPHHNNSNHDRTTASLQRLLLLSASFPLILLPCLYTVFYTTSIRRWEAFGIGTAAVYVIYQSFDLLVLAWRWGDDIPAQQVFYRTDKSLGFECGMLRCRDEFYPMDGDGKDGGLWRRRVKWAADLTFCLRGVGWNVEYKKTVIERLRMKKEYGGKRGRKGWVREKIAKLVGIYISLDLLKTYMALDPWFGIVPPSEGVPGQWVYDAMGEVVGGVVRMYVRNIMGALAVYGAVEGQSCVIALIFVLLKFSTPTEFPRAFGRISDRRCWSLAGFWGNGWHQSFHRVFTAPVKTRRGVERIVVPFVMSSGLHFAGSYVAGGLGKEAVVFFWGQCVGILGQNLVVSWLDVLIGRRGMPVNKGKENGNGYHANGKKQVSMGNNSRPAAGVRAVRPSFEISRHPIVEGFTLVSSLIWLLTVSTRYFGEYIEGGMFSIEPVPVSFCRLAGAVDGEWWRW